MTLTLNLGGAKVSGCSSGCGQRRPSWESLAHGGLDLDTPLLML